MTIFDFFLIFLIFFYSFYSEFFPGRFDTSGSMIPHLVPKIEGGTLSVMEEKEKKKKKDRVGGIPVS